ncbi:MAG: winged helix-turn-helix transcriptional regulator [Planctomycetes bacterium]|nr:winged helix-turn-helix transcriptional regulator [Planctomycetota bacterium]
MEEFGLTGPQLAVLGAAARMGRISVSALARMVHLSQPTVTGILDRLVRRGLMERVREERDRRNVIVIVTLQGHDVLVKAPSLLQDRFRRELAKLREWELTMTLGTLQRIAEMMEADGLEASPILVAGPIDAATESRSKEVASDTPPAGACPESHSLSNNEH